LTATDKMANHHYGRIGDIWKHLPLAEILEIEQPAEYWESHVGSTRYPLTHSWQRDFGVFHFLSNVASSEALNASRYRKVLDECAGFYPGSSDIAMRVLGPNTAFILCDTDPESVGSLLQSSRELGILRARCENVDGNDLLWNEIIHLSEARAQRLFVHLDPWNCMAPSELNGRTSLDLFRELSRKGAAVVLWVGFDSMDQRTTIVKHFEGGWLSEIHLDLIRNPRPELNPGVFGCGLYSTNLSPRSVQAVERLGHELARIYEAALLPSGKSGRLLYQSTLRHQG
jgi:23S rRNA (adenine2030-N6)-methyltransferase